MKTYEECVPCFFRQLYEGARITRVSSQKRGLILDRFSERLNKVPRDASPPEVARIGYKLLSSISGIKDPYLKIKEKSNRYALKIYGKLRDKITGSRDSLLAAVEAAIAGNIIDFGVKNNLNVGEELAKILAKERKAEKNKAAFHYEDFKASLKKARTIVYLADNAGEVVFDLLLIEEIKRVYPEKTIYYVVKGRPVINDALCKDAQICGINKHAKIISNGTDAPGTVLRLCTKVFRRIYKKADMIISKGQGNFETLNEEKRRIFFLFMVKCPVVARHTGYEMGNIVLLYNN